MLPTPAIRFWSSSMALIGARHCLASACRCAPVNSGSNGSTPRRAAKNASSASGPSASSPVPKRRGSTNSSSVAEVEGHARVQGPLRRAQQQRAGHSQVQHQVGLGLELPDEVLAAAPEALDGAALDRGGDLVGHQRERPAGVVDHQPLERPALDVRGQVAADRLDLGQLGHR